MAALELLYMATLLAVFGSPRANEYGSSHLIPLQGIQEEERGLYFQLIEDSSYFSWILPKQIEVLSEHFWVEGSNRQFLGVYQNNFFWNNQKVFSLYMIMICHCCHFDLNYSLKQSDFNTLWIYGPGPWVAQGCHIWQSLPYMAALRAAVFWLLPNWCIDHRSLVLVFQ